MGATHGVKRGAGPWQRIAAKTARRLPSRIPCGGCANGPAAAQFTQRVCQSALR